MDFRGFEREKLREIFFVFVRRARLLHALYGPEEIYGGRARRGEALRGLREFALSFREREAIGGGHSYRGSAAHGHVFYRRGDFLVIAADSVFRFERQRALVEQTKRVPLPFQRGRQHGCDASLNGVSPDMFSTTAPAVPSLIMMFTRAPSLSDETERSTSPRPSSHIE